MPVCKQRGLKRRGVGRWPTRRIVSRSRRCRSLISRGRESPTVDAYLREPRRRGTGQLLPGRPRRVCSCLVASRRRLSAWPAALRTEKCDSSSEIRFSQRKRLCVCSPESQTVRDVRFRSLSISFANVIVTVESRQFRSIFFKYLVQHS